MTTDFFFITEDALEDIKKISIWYAVRKPDLADDFHKELFNSIHIICKSPYVYLKYGMKNNIRRFLMKRFPYKIFYDSSKEPIRIIAVVHTSRSSRYLSKRVK
jgi:plasmid stabilization system protein ParE